MVGIAMPPDDHRSARRASMPDGIGPEATRAPGWYERNAGLIALLILATLVAIGLSGLVGGGSSTRREATGRHATLAIEAPTMVRTGQIYETVLAVAATDAAIAKPVIAISPALWHELTINSMTPQADQESFADGLFRFEFKPLRAGDRLRFKIDAQVNPGLRGSVAGNVALLDDRTELARIPVTIRILP